MVIIKEDIAEMKVEISLAENMIYVVKDGQVHLIEPPTSGHDKQSFVFELPPLSLRLEEGDS